MNKYFRAIGFQKYRTLLDSQSLSGDVLSGPDWIERWEENGELKVYAGKAFGPGFGIVVRGVQDERGAFHQDCLYPYFSGSTVTSHTASSIQKLSDRDAYCGLCEENQLGLSLIFSLQNAMEYKKSGLPAILPSPMDVSMAALSTEGKILLPVEKSQKNVLSDKASVQSRNQLLEAARNGDEEAIETLTMEDMDLYSQISGRIRREDLYSIVESSFMPCGVECDQYTVIGEILSAEELTNSMTKEILIHMEIYCNEMPFHVIINKSDLVGIPARGRRFKGEIWMQGRLHIR